MLDGMKLTFPGTGTDANDTGQTLVFRCETVDVSHTVQSTTIGGGSSIIAQLSQFANQAGLQAGGNRTKFSIDSGGGLHITTLDFRRSESSSLRWGETDDGIWNATNADAITQMQTLDNAFRQITADGIDPITLEVFEYSSTGRFAPLKVAPREPAVEFSRDRDASAFTGRIDFVDVTDISAVLDAIKKKK